MTGTSAFDHLAFLANRRAAQLMGIYAPLPHEWDCPCDECSYQRDADADAHEALINMQGR